MCPARGDIPTRSEDFASLQARVLELHEGGRYRECLDVAVEAARRFPERAHRTSYWVACLHCLLGDPDRGLRTLQEGLRRGLWYPPDWLMTDPDLAPLRGRPEFDAVLEESRRRLAEAQAEAGPDLVVLEAEPPRPGAPLLMALHGAPGRADEFAPRWEPARRAGFLVAVPQSSQVRSMDGFGWDNRHKAERELTQAYRRLLERHAFDPGRVVLAGFSQGAGLAVTLALRGRPFPARGFLAVGPALRDREALLTHGEAAAARGVRGSLVIGDRDWARPQVEELHAGLSARGIACELSVVPGVGHGFPPDFDARLRPAIDFVLGSG